MTGCIAQVDAVQTQQWPARRIGFGQLPVMTLKHFVQVVSLAQGGIALLLPVVKVPGNDDRFFGRQGFEQLVKQHDL